MVSCLGETLKKVNTKDLLNRLNANTTGKIYMHPNKELARPVIFHNQKDKFLHDASLKNKAERGLERSTQIFFSTKISYSIICKKYESFMLISLIVFGSSSKYRPQGLDTLFTS